MPPPKKPPADLGQAQRPPAQPAVEIGESVLWHDDQDGQPVAMALVTFVGSDTVNLAILGEGYQNFLVRTGVRHKKHPDRPLVQATGEGVWSHRPAHTRTQDRLARLEAMMNDVYAAVMPGVK